MVTDTNIYNFGLKDNYGDFIIAVYIAIGGCVVSKFIRVVIVLFLGIAGYSLCLESEEFTAFSEEESGAPIDVELKPFKINEEHNEWYCPNVHRAVYKDSKIKPFNENIKNNRNIVSSGLRSQCKSVYVRGYYRRDGTYVRPHYRRRPNRRRRL